MTRRFFVGQWLDVKDTVNNWLEATVMDMSNSGKIHVRNFYGGGLRLQQNIVLKRPPVVIPIFVAHVRHAV